MTRDTLLRGTAALACCMALATPFATPAEAATQQTYASGQWTAFTGTTADNHPLCGIATTGAEGRRIAIQQQAGDTGLHLTLNKTSWNIPNGTGVDLTVQIDRGAALPLQGTGNQNEVAVDIPFEQSIPLMRQVRSGTVLRVFFPSGNEQMWTGGLSGTSAVINAFNDCRASLAPAAAAGVPTQPYAAPADQTPAAPPSTQPFAPAPAAPAPAPAPAPSPAPAPHS